MYDRPRFSPVRMKNTVAHLFSDGGASLRWPTGRSACSAATPYVEDLFAHVRGGALNIVAPTAGAAVTSRGRSVHGR